MADSSVVIFAVLVIFVGLLLIDVVPLQETMICKDYANDTVCPETFFSQSYTDAREKFLAAARAAEGVVEHHLVVSEGGVEYFMDTAFFRGAKEGKLLVHASGTHGVEGFTGSAIQTKLLREWNASFQEGPSVLFIHAINPYGMAHFRRFNERNTDLNRNYLSSAQWLTVKTQGFNGSGYDAFRQFFAPDAAPRFIDRYWFFVRSAPLLVRHGFTATKRAVVTGQYHHPNGILYGGDGEAKSVTVLREILKKYSRNVEDSIFVDVHTGLGPTGVDTIMASTEEDATRARAIFTNARVQSDVSAESGPSSGYALAQGIIRPRDELGPHSLPVTEEFGTVSPFFVLRALVLENAAYHHCRGSYVHEVMRTWLRDAFYPQDMKYKKSVLSRGTSTFWNAAKHLSA